MNVLFCFHLLDQKAPGLSWKFKISKLAYFKAYKIFETPFTSDKYGKFQGIRAIRLVFSRNNITCDHLP